MARDKAELAAEVDRQVLLDAIDIVPIPLAIFDADLRMVFANWRFRRVYTAPPDLQIPTYDDVIRSTLAVVEVEDEEAYLAEMRAQVLNPDGKPREVRIKGGQIYTYRWQRVGDDCVAYSLSDLTARRASEQLAKARLAQLEAVLRETGEGLVILDGDLRIMLMNEGYASMTGEAGGRPAAPGTPMADLIRDRLARTRGLDGAALEDATGARLSRLGEAASEERTELEPIAGDRVAEVRNRRTPEGHIVSVYTDVTEREARTRELRDLAERLNAVLEDQTEMICRFDADFRLTFANGAYRDAFESPGEDIIGKRFLDLIPEEEARGRIVRTLQGLTPSQPFSEDTYNETTVDGRATWQTWINRAIFDDDDRIREYQAVGREVTAEREAQLALERSDERFRTLAAAHPVPVIVFDWETGAVAHASRSATALVAPGRGDILGMTAADIMADLDWRAEIGRLARDEGAARRIETEILRADGARIPVEITAHRIDFDAREALICGVLDISERKRAEAEIARHRDALAQSEKMNAMGSLLASVSHELNNPLSIIVGQSELLDAAPLDPATAERVKKVRAAADRCARIVKTFLAMARQKAPGRVAVNLNALVRDAVELTQYASRSGGVELRVAPLADDPSVRGDRDQLLQVLVNLIINAQQALAERAGPKVIEIGGAERDGEVLLRVDDSGPGVPPDIRTQIFEAFFTTKPEGAGTGVGLALCRNIVEAHGGALDVGDSAHGGASFVASFPRSDGEPEAAQESGAAHRWAGVPPLGILVVDDETEIAETTRDLLSPDRHDIHLAKDGAEALALLRRHDIDVVISDLRMPGMDGPTFWRAVAAEGQFPTARIGFVTGDTLSEAVRRFIDQSQAPLIEKPFDADELRELVVELLSKEV